MNAIAMTIINSRKEYWLNQGSNKQTSLLKYCTDLDT